MRGLAAALMLVIAGAGQGITHGLAASSTPPAPAISPEEAHAGCVHTQLRACMISLGTAFWFDMNVVTAQIAKRNEVDVNGRTANRKIVVDVKVPKRGELIGITLVLASPSPNDEVVKIELALPNNPDLAHTGSEYDTTQLYDAVSVLLGDRCPGLDKMTLYRFYENGIKPKEVTKTRITGTRGTSDYTTQTTDTGAVPFCGATFSLHRETSWYGPVDIPGKLLDKALSHAVSTLTIE
jgi:hypothetical protein